MGKYDSIVNVGPFGDPVSRNERTASSTSDDSLSFVYEFKIQIPEPQSENEHCKQLISILNNLLIKKDIPRCLMAENAAYLNEGIVTHAFFNYISEHDRSKIQDQIRVFNVIHGNYINIPSLSVTTLIPWISQNLNISRMQASIVLGDFMQLKLKDALRVFRYAVSVYPLMRNASAFRYRQVL